MSRDEREAELRSVYKQMNKAKKQKMELLAVSLLNAQAIIDNEKQVKQEKVLQEPAEHE